MSYSQWVGREELFERERSGMPEHMLSGAGEAAYAAG